MRPIKWVLLGLGALVALVVLGVLVIVWLVDPNSFKSQIETAVRDRTGREFTLVGDIDLGFFPWLSLRTGEGRFGGPPGFGPQPLISWKSARLGVKLMPLLSGDVIADRIFLSDADLRLVRHADGRANWLGLGGAEPADPDAKPMQLNVDGVQIENSRVSFIDEGVPRRVEITGFYLTTGEISLGEPFTDTEIAGVLHMEGFAEDGVPFRLDLPEVKLPEDFSAVEVQEFSITFGGFEADGKVTGTLGETQDLAGKIETNAFDPRALLASVGIAPPKTADAQALGKVRFAGEWAFRDGAIRIDPLSLDLDDTHFKGSFTRTGGADALGEFSLSGTSIDIARYIPPTDPASEPFVLPTAALKALRFRGEIRLEHATLDDIDMKEVTLRLLLDEQGLRSVAKPSAGAP
ncbi:MAG TPA: AsmA family protein [Steroidobacteraceae bacterium]|nr:AsmA family protein [Steroidobacteraceae bacterium]